MDSEALSAFREAFDKHPDHLYLAPYIRHLEFKQSNAYASLEPVFDTCPGERRPVRENGDLSGIKIVNEKGNESFYPRSNQGVI